LCLVSFTHTVNIEELNKKFRLQCFDFFQGNHREKMYCG